MGQGLSKLGNDPFGTNRAVSRGVAGVLNPLSDAPALVTPYSVGVLNGRGGVPVPANVQTRRADSRVPSAADAGVVCPEAASVTERAAVPSKLRAPAEGVHD
jgi:hypothetical protein